MFRENFRFLCKLSERDMEPKMRRLIYSDPTSVPFGIEWFTNLSKLPASNVKFPLDQLPEVKTAAKPCPCVTLTCALLFPVQNWFIIQWPRASVRDQIPLTIP